MGKPGSGKGTQAKLLSESTGWPIKVTSDGLREIASSGGMVGEKMKETIDAGILVPSCFPLYVFLKTLFALPENGSLILDGFNRMSVEAELITETLEWIGRPFTVLYIRVSDDEVRKRLALRKEKEGRADDDVVDKRLAAYYEKTDKSIEFFRQKGVLIEVNGEQTPEAIAEDVRKVLKI